jgi:hypothetical protein
VLPKRRQVAALQIRDPFLVFQQPASVAFLKFLDKVSLPF